MSLKVIRTAWGSSEYIRKETINRSFLPNEIVYVWGSENDRYLRGLGYDTILVSRDICDPRYGSMKMKYYHKLEAIILADSDFDEYILVDWDTYTDMDLDSDFYSLLRSKSEVQCPLYCLPKYFFEEISKSQLSDDFKDFFKHQNELLPEFSWNLLDSYVFPNFCFFYSRGANIGKILMGIAKRESLYSNVEEFSLFKWANCTLDEYIEKHEPLVARGQIKDSLKIVQESLDYLNFLIDSKIDKKIYIKHK